MTENATGRDPRAARLTLPPVMVGIGLMLLGTLAVLARQGGNEPPIRVRNGSMIFELVTKNWPSAKWSSDGNNWTPSEGTSKGTLQVVVQSANGYDCPAGKSYQGNSVEVAYDKTTKVTVHGSGNGKTFLTPKAALDLVAGSNDTVLKHGEDGVGVITSFVVRGHGQPQTCSVTPGAAHPTIDVLICSWDPAKPCKVE